MNINTKGKVQNNEHGVNVLVETDTSSNSHISRFNTDVTIVSVLTDSEIVAMWKNRDDKDEIDLAKQWIKSQDGYATSNCKDEYLGISHQSIVKFK